MVMVTDLRTRVLMKCDLVKAPYAYVIQQNLSRTDRRRDALHAPPHAYSSIDGDFY